MNGGNDSDEQDFYSIEFPMAFETATTPRANDYEVAVELRRCDVTLTVASYRVFSPLYGRASAVDKENVKCLVPCAKVPKPGFQKVRFAVRPLNSFGTKGKPICLEHK